MNTLLTAFALVLLGASAGCAFIAYRAAQSCTSIDDALRRSVGRLSANEAAIESLSAQLSKLRGKYYADRYHDQAAALDEDRGRRDPDTLDALNGETDRDALRRAHAAAIMPAGVVNRGT